MAYMDEYATEIFDLWYSGKARDVEVFDNSKWAAYMQADRGLEQQIDHHLTMFAYQTRDDFFKRSLPGVKPVLTGQKYSLTFHAEVGSQYGGYRTGYAQLHGTNRSVGDFQIQGTFAMGPGQPGKLNFTFTQNQMTFNDIVDPNFKYRSDATLADACKVMAVATGGLKPKNYTLRIRWREPGPWTYEINSTPSAPGTKPDWLQTYRNIP
jgi:hypothetical protein